MARQGEGGTAGEKVAEQGRRWHGREKVGGWGSDYGPLIQRQLGQLKGPEPGSNRTKHDGER